MRWVHRSITTRHAWRLDDRRAGLRIGCLRLVDTRLLLDVWTRLTHDAGGGGCLARPHELPPVLGRHPLTAEAVVSGQVMLRDAVVAAWSGAHAPLALALVALRRRSRWSGRLDGWSSRGARWDSRSRRGRQRSSRKSERSVLTRRSGRARLVSTRFGSAHAHGAGEVSGQLLRSRSWGGLGGRAVTSN